MEHKGWKTLKSRIAHENPWWRVCEDDVIRPDGKEGKYFVAETDDSVMIVPVDEDGNVYCVGQSRYTMENALSWEFPSGGCMPDLTPLESAQKELREEAGLLAEEWEELGIFYPLNGFCKERCHVFLAKRFSYVGQELEGSEDIIVKKIPESEFRQMISDGGILCGMTITAFHLYLAKKV